MKYTKDSKGIQTLTGDVPCDPWNSDYVELMRRVRDEGLVIDPWVPPAAPTPGEMRDRQYRLRLDADVVRVVLCQVLLTGIADTPGNGPLRARVASRLAAAKASILATALAIEAESPDG